MTTNVLKGLLKDHGSPTQRDESLEQSELNNQKQEKKKLVVDKYNIKSVHVYLLSYMMWGNDTNVWPGVAYYMHKAPSIQ